MKELEGFQEEMRGRIKLMEYRMSVTSPTELDRALLDLYYEVLEDASDLNQE